MVGGEDLLTKAPALGSVPLNALINQRQLFIVKTIGEIMKDLDLYLIRHGRTNRNATPDLIGQYPEEPLNDLGKEQSKKLAKRLSHEKLYFDHIYCSPYKRAMETCEIVNQYDDGANYITPTYRDALREINQGDGIDQSREKTFTPEFLHKLDALGMAFKYPNGESLLEVEARSVQLLHEILQDNYVEGKIAFFTHGMTIKSILHYIMGFNHQLTWRVDIDNTSISHLEFRDDKWFIKTINDYSHLKE